LGWGRGGGAGASSSSSLSTITLLPVFFDCICCILAKSAGGFLSDPVKSIAPAEVALAVVAAESDEDDDDDAITPELGTISGHRYLSNDSTVPRIAKTLFP
jgi:hypothetical protein